VANRLRSVKATDVNSHSLGVEISNPADRTRKVNHIMIPKNSTIPYSISQRFVTNVANQQRVHVKLLQGEASDVSACTLIGDFRITDLPANLPAGSPVELTYRYDSTGRIVAEAKELTGGRGARAEIVRDSGLTDTNVDAFEVLAKDYTVE
jgi:molecular chaperone DnaK